MKTIKHLASSILLVFTMALPLFAQGPPPPPTVPLDGGLTALIALVTAGVFKLLKDRKKSDF